MGRFDRLISLKTDDETVRRLDELARYRLTTRGSIMRQILDAGLDVFERAVALEIRRRRGEQGEGR